MKTTSRITSFSTLVLCVACVEPAEVTSKPVDVTFTSKSAASGIKEFDPIFVRSYGVVDRKYVETTGIVCSFSGSGFNGTITTPGIVNVPEYGSLSRAIVFNCSDGTTSKISQSLPFNLTSEQKLGRTLSPAGIFDGATFGGRGSARDRTEDDWSYRSVAVSF